MYNIFATILQEQQLKGLWKGMTPVSKIERIHEFLNIYIISL